MTTEQMNREVAEKEERMTHIMFCCNQHCLRVEMDKLLAKHPEAEVRYSDGIVTYGGDRTFFFVGTKIEMNRVRGRIFDSWSTCGNVSYGLEEKEYLDSRIGRK
ncbi:MAG: hypothetical protein WC294_00305 [Methanoregula sp.]|jgi:hypothetical protein